MEKRRQQRVAKVLLARVSRGSIEFFAYVQDVAKSGVGMTCNRLMEVKDEVTLHLNVPRLPSMILVGTLVWRRNLPVIAKNKYQYGVHLSAPPQEYVDFVDTLLKRDFERRQHPRFPDVLEVKNEDVIDLLDAATADVSAGGLYIRTSSPLDVGTQYEMLLIGEQLPEPIFCLGEVVAVFDTEMDELDHPYGAGVKILSFKKGHQERFEQYLKGLEELYRFHWPPELEQLRKDNVDL